MDLTNAEFDEIHFETISSDGDASDGDANSEDMDEDELDDVMASMNIADDVIIVPQVQPHRPQVQPPKRPTVPEEEEEDANGRKGLPTVNRTVVEKVSHLMRMTQQKILEPGFYIARELVDSRRVRPEPVRKKDGGEDYRGLESKIIVD